MKKILIFTALLLAMTILGYSQEHKIDKLEYNTTAFEGIWLAKDGNKSYKMELKKVLVPSNEFLSTEFILGSMSFFEDGKLQRTISMSDFLNTPSAVISLAKSNTILKGRYVDTEKKCMGDLIFTLNHSNPREASWEVKLNQPPRGILFDPYADFNKNGLNMPAKLTFEKQ